MEYDAEEAELQPPEADAAEREKRARYLIYHRAHDRFTKEIAPLVNTRCEQDWLYAMFFAFSSSREAFIADFRGILDYIWQYFDYGEAFTTEQDEPTGSVGQFVRQSLRVLVAANRDELYQLLFLFCMAVFEPVRRAVAAQCAHDRFTPQFEQKLLEQTEDLVSHDFSYATVQGRAQQYLWALATYYETRCTLAEAVLHVYNPPPPLLFRTATAILDRH